MSEGGYIHFRVPGPPEAKRRPRTRVIGKRATIYTTAEDKRYEAKVAAAATVAMEGRPPIPGPVVVLIKAWLPIPASASKPRQARILSGEEWWFGPIDCDNGAKIVLDGMKNIVWFDDKQVMRLVVDKLPYDGPGACDVVVVKK